MEKKIESLLAEIIRIKTELTELEKEAEDVKNRIILTMKSRKYTKTSMSPTTTC